jgi:hypothetical protein
VRASARLLLGVAAISAACGDSTTTSPTPVTGDMTQLFSGTLPVRGSNFYSFTLSQAGTVELTLASVTLDGRGSTLTTAIGLGSGTPNGTDCDITNSVTTSPSLKAQLRTAMGPGIYCVRVADVGNLTTSVNFTVRIVNVVTTPVLTPGTPTTETFASVLADRGFTSHAFVAETAGTISVTLTSVGPPSVPIGLGVGIRGTSVPCILNTALTTQGGAAPQLAVSVDRGFYCVQVYDIGTLTAPTSFSTTITRP